MVDETSLKIDMDNMTEFDEKHLRAQLDLWLLIADKSMHNLRHLKYEIWDSRWNTCEVFFLD